MKKKINLKEYFEAMKLKINDLNIRIFHFNMVQVNTFVCYDETKNGVIVDPGMCSKEEEQMLLDFITKENIEIKFIINTHPHIDHVLGNDFCVKTFKAPLVMHEAGLPIYTNSASYAVSFGFPISDYPTSDIFVNDEDTLSFGNQVWKVIYTPGHADGSICLYDEKNKFVIVGDVLFMGSIGRTDLPTGNFHQLMQNIKEKLLTLGDDILVIPGHAETTTIGAEKMNNPYL
ncbi:MAG: MBL fold metallo-hydrolase [Bacteroidetes bacterium]|nr:MBL fold metallo-hydrolase [Bacteroidota bacterium]MCL2301692.1 MBL fold metallo-hydrolase [Lentimicrobiaceae bacterium]